MREGNREDATRRRGVASDAGRAKILWSRGARPVGCRKLIVWLPVVVALTACEPTTAPTPMQASTPPVPAGSSDTIPFEWPGEHEDSPSLSFPSATDAVTFLSEHMDADITLPTRVPSYVHLDTPVSVFLATDSGIRSAQVKLTTERGVLGIEYGVSALDGCAPERSIRVTVSGQPARLRISADPDGSPRKWVELIWPATLKHPNGVFGLFGWISPRAVLAMAESMSPVSSPPVITAISC
jgi:hypothetical protein